MSSGIYEIVNLVNGKRYVGSAVSFECRWREHRRQLNADRHHSRHLQRSWNKHGAEAFSFRIIEVCEPASLMRERLRNQATEAWEAKTQEERHKHMEMVRAARGRKTAEV